MRARACMCASMCVCVCVFVCLFDLMACALDLRGSNYINLKENTPINKNRCSLFI